MPSRTQLIEQAKQASENLFAWASFVSHTEFLWQDDTLVTDAEAWQSLWFELEIINALALAEWEEQGRPADWSAAWRESYQQDARELVAELLTLTA